MGSEAMGCIILSPTGRGAKKDASGKTMSRRRISLDGAVIGLLANSAQSMELLDAVYDELAERHEFAGSLRVTKLAISSPPSRTDMETLVSQATVAVVGTGS